VANFGDMTNAVLTACKLRPDTDQASVRRVINDAYLAVARTLDLLQTSKVVTFTAGQQDYSITNDLGIDDLLSLETIIGPSSGNLANVTMVSSDAPWMFALYGIDTLMLYPGPISNAAATLYYTKQPVALYDDSDEPELLPRDLHWVVEERAVELAASRWARNSQLAADAHARYQLGLGEARSWLSERDGVWPKEIATLSTIHAARRRPADRSTDY
jgi:hypothetical protein